MKFKERESEGPAQGALNIGRRIIALLVDTVETRFSLAITELEEEKTRLIQLFLMAGITLLCALFGLLTLLVFIFLSVDPQYRLIALGLCAGVLLLCAAIGAFITLKRARAATLLKETRQQLKIDKILLGQRNEQ